MTCNKLYPELPREDPSPVVTPTRRQLDMQQMNSVDETEEFRFKPNNIGRRDCIIETAKVAASIIIIIGLAFALINIGLLQVRVSTIEQKAEEVRMYPAGRAARLRAPDDGSRSASEISLNVVRPLYAALTKVKLAADEGSETAAAYLKKYNKKA